jgi:hypothetical protein
MQLGLRCLELSLIPWVRVNGLEYHSRRGIGFSLSDYPDPRDPHALARPHFLVATGGLRWLTFRKFFFLSVRPDSCVVFKFGDF